MESKVKDGNFYVVQSFMVKDLKLKGLEKEVYAIIYGFSQADQKFDGSLQYLADWTLSTKQGVVKVLKSLLDKGLINKEEEFKCGVKFVKYYTTEFNGGIKHSLTGGIKLSLTNNIDNNKIEDKKERKTASEYDSIIETKVKNENVKSTIYEFIKMRKLIKKPMTNRALELMIGKLHKLATTPDDAIAILEQSIMNNWQDIYELKEKKQKINYVEGYNGEYAELV